MTTRNRGRIGGRIENRCRRCKASISFSMPLSKPLSKHGGEKSAPLRRWLGIADHRSIHKSTKRHLSAFEEKPFVILDRGISPHRVGSSARTPAPSDSPAIDPPIEKIERSGNLRGLSLPSWLHFPGDTRRHRLKNSHRFHLYEQAAPMLRRRKKRGCRERRMQQALESKNT